MGNSKIRFIISVFGHGYSGLLISNIYSIIKTNPESLVSVFWEDIEENKIEPIKKTFSKFDFIETNYEFGENKAKRISSKTLLWEQAAKKYQGKKLCFLDVDMLVVKDISHFFRDNDFHVAFTYKDEHYPLNTGVMLSDGSKEATNFFTLWKKKTMEIIDDKEFFRQANDTKLPYGGADQMSLYLLLDYKRNKNTYTHIYTNTVLKGIPCGILNETNSVPITKKTQIIHYKGGWQSVLLKGMNFSKYRTKKDSWEMYIYFLKQYKEAVQFINEKLKTNYSLSFFNIKIPFYLNKESMKENKIFYVIHFIIKQTQQIVFLTIRKVKKNNQSLDLWIFER